jgi:hypothetical protein
MKRRDLIVASAGALVPGLVRGGTPCPPPQVSVSGGGTATTNCNIVSGSSYSTNFDSTENPISESAKWVNGQAIGLNWSNVQTGSGNAYGSRHVDTGGVGRYSDPIAHLSTSFMTFSANQYAQGIVHRAAGYSHASSSSTAHEIELLLRFQITANSARGYEILISRDDWIVIVRWNGPVGNYTQLASTGGPISPVVSDGDLIRAEIGSDNRVRVFRNGVLALTGPVNTSFASGQPGIGFWPTPGATLASYGWKSFQAGNI